MDLQIGQSYLDPPLLSLEFFSLFNEYDITYLKLYVAKRLLSRDYKTTRNRANKALLKRYLVNLFGMNGMMMDYHIKSIIELAVVKLFGFGRVTGKGSHNHNGIIINSHSKLIY
jgi:hypothetical protein